MGSSEIFQSAYIESARRRAEQEQEKKKIAAQLLQEIVRGNPGSLKPGEINHALETGLLPTSRSRTDFLQADVSGPSSGMGHFKVNPATGKLELARETREPINFASKKAPMRPILFDQSTGKFIQAPEGVEDKSQILSFSPPVERVPPAPKKTPQQEADMKAYESLLKTLEIGMDPSPELLKVAVPAGKRLGVDMAVFAKEAPLTPPEKSGFLQNAMDGIKNIGSAALAKGTQIAKKVGEASAKKIKQSLESGDGQALAAPKGGSTAVYKGKKYQSFASEEEAEAANLPAGAEILIGGKLARVRR